MPRSNEPLPATWTAKMRRSCDGGGVDVMMWCFFLRKLMAFGSCTFEPIRLMDTYGRYIGGVGFLGCSKDRQQPNSLWHFFCGRAKE